jgi:hypothetical protein
MDQLIFNKDGIWVVDGSTYLIASIMSIILHLILLFPFRLANISSSNSRYVKVDRVLLALLYILDLSVQYLVYLACSLAGGRRGITLGAVSDKSVSVVVVVVVEVEVEGEKG